VQEVVLYADMQCETCQKRVADIITKMNGKLVSVSFCSVEIRRYHVWLYVLHIIVKLLVDFNALCKNCFLQISIFLYLLCKKRLEKTERKRAVVLTVFVATV